MKFIKNIFATIGVILSACMVYYVYDEKVNKGKEFKEIFKTED